MNKNTKKYTTFPIKDKILIRSMVNDTLTPNAPHKRILTAKQKQSKSEYMKAYWRKKKAQERKGVASASKALEALEAFGYDKVELTDITKMLKVLQDFKLD